MRNRTFPGANEPLHQTPQPNRDVTAFSGKILVCEAGGSQIEGDGQLLFRWLPTPSLRFEMALPGVFAGVGLNEVLLDAPLASLAGLRAAVQSISSNTNLPGTSVAGIVLDDFSLHGDGATLTELAFDIPNFHDYLGDPVARGGGGSRSRLTLEAGDWLVNLDATADLDKRIGALRSLGGFVITHAGTLTRKDGNPFSFADTNEIRSALSTWLSFSRGLWCSPVFWYSKSDGWTRYTKPRLSQWRGVQSWFPLLGCDRARCTFPRLVQLLADPTWKDPLELAIYWYIHANECAGGGEGSLVLAQTAFEMLAWTYLVEDRGVLTRQAWDQLNGASARIERLLTEMGIPVDLPATECPELYAWAQSAGRGGSGPDALVGIRNAFVHPNTKELEEGSGRSLICETRSVAACAPISRSNDLDAARVRRLNLFQGSEWLPERGQRRKAVASHLTSVSS